MLSLPHPLFLNASPYCPPTLPLSFFCLSLLSAPQNYFLFLPLALLVVFLLPSSVPFYIIPRRILYPYTNRKLFSDLAIDKGDTRMARAPIKRRRHMVCALGCWQSCPTEYRGRGGCGDRFPGYLAYD